MHEKSAYLHMNMMNMKTDRVIFLFGAVETVLRRAAFLNYTTKARVFSDFYIHVDLEKSLRPGKMTLSFSVFVCLCVSVCV